MSLDRISPRAAFTAGALACAGLLAFGYYLQYVQGLNPCPLCLVQRGFFYAVLAVCVAGAAHGPGRAGTVAYASLAALFGLGGTASAARQVWLQHLPKDKVPQCGPDLAFMLENFPLSTTLQRLVSGTGECAEVDWTFLGMSIAEWSLAWFLLFVVCGVALALRATRLRAAP